MSIIGEVTELVNENDRLRIRCKELEQSTIRPERYYNAILTTEMVAALHGVTPSLVRKYAKLGMIELHPQSSDSKMFFRGSDVLAIDFSELRKQLSIKTSKL